MAIAKTAGNATLIIVGSAVVLVLVFAGIALAVILSLIPSYLSTKSVTPLGEEYCISNLYLNATVNSSFISGAYPNLTINASYDLSSACYRILQAYKSDSLLSACLITNCSVIGSNFNPNSVVSGNVGCYTTIYYSSRCSDESPSSGLNNYVNSTSNSACRKKRMSNINGALGSSAVKYTNVATLIINSVAVPIQTLYGIPFSNSSQLGAFYCGTITQTAIASAVSAQATG